MRSFVYDEFSRRLIAAVEALKVAPASENGAQQGPLINAKAVEKIQEHIADALDKGARLLSGGKPHVLGGSFFEQTVLGDVRAEMLVARDETFGPLTPIFRFASEAEAMAMANDVFAVPFRATSDDPRRSQLAVVRHEDDRLPIPTPIRLNDESPARASSSEVYECCS